MTEQQQLADAINSLCVIAFENAQAKGFHDKDFLEDLISYASDGNVDTIAFGKWREMMASQRLMLMVSELAEALEELRSGHRPDETYIGAKGSPEGVPVELADVLIRIFDFAGGYGINLGDIVVEKMAYNSGRARLHGGKAF